MGRIWNRNEIRVGAHPQRIVGEYPLVDVLMAKPDSQRVQALPGKAVFWWKQADRSLLRRVENGDIQGKMDVQDVKCELRRVEIDFESDGFADAPVHTACFV